MALVGIFQVKLKTSSNRLYFFGMIAGLITLAAFPGMLYANEEDYLRELEEEARDTAGLSKTKPANKTSATTMKTLPKQPTLSPKTQRSKKTTPNPENKKISSEQNKIDNFEQLLEFERPSTYRFYTRLEKNQKLLVVNQYLKHKKLAESSKLIFDLYFKRQK